MTLSLYGGVFAVQIVYMPDCVYALVPGTPVKVEGETEADAFRLVHVALKEWMDE